MERVSKKYRAPEEFRELPLALGNGVTKAGAGSMFMIFFFLLMGSLFYVLAQYYHLTLEDWSVWKGLLIVMPLVFLEYNFVLRAGHMAHASGFSVMNIFLTTMCMNFVLLYIFNQIAIGDPVHGTDAIAFGLVAGAFALSYNPSSGTSGTTSNSNG